MADGASEGEGGKFGRKEAKESIKVVVLDTHQYNLLFNKIRIFMEKILEVVETKIEY